MDQNALVNELVKLGARFLEEFGKAYPIAVAFWMKDKEESRWHLHIASEKINDADDGKANGVVIRVARQLQNPSFDPFLIRLCYMDEKIVKFALDFQRENPGMPAVFDVPGYYGVEVEGMYIYPPVQAAAA
jgi:hypothetical protein